MYRIFIAGDSTASVKEKNCYPETGWGEAFRFFLKKNCLLHNYAKNARSTKSFKEEGLFERILQELNKGDFVLLQFGHNDGKEKDSSRYTAPYGEYQNNLSSFIDDIRIRGATPILLTSVSRRQFGDDGKVLANTVGDYPKAMMAVAKEKRCECVDVYQATVELINSYGVEKSKQLFMYLQPKDHDHYPDGLEDDTHFSPFGALEVAKSIASLLLDTSMGTLINL